MIFITFASVAVVQIDALPSSVVATSVAPVSTDVRAILLDNARILRVRKGQIVLSVGLPANDVFLVLEGRLSVSLISPQGRETVLRSIGPDEIFGELAAIDGHVRSADVVAAEASRLALIPGATFLSLIETTPAIARWITQQLSQQVRYLTSKVFELSNMSVGSRLIAELLRLANEQPADDDSAIIARPPTQAELAARIGTNRETVTREMTLLTERGLIARKGRQIVVPSLERLVARLDAHAPSI